jgi:hypothetical protein
MTFCKIFGTGDQQRLVKVDSTARGNAPEVRIYFQPSGLGLCSIAFQWDDNSDKSWDLAEAAFARMDAERVETLVQAQIDLMEGKQ